VDRGRRGSKHHLIACGEGNPLAVALTAANVNDVTQTIALVDAIPPVRGKRGRPRRRPRRLLGDGAYHSRRDRLALRARGIQPKIAKPKSPHGSGLGRERWVVERTLSWLHQYRRLRVRYERREDIHEAFLAIGCGLICFKALVRADALC
jgi:transposase